MKVLKVSQQKEGACVKDLSCELGETEVLTHFDSEGHILDRTVKTVELLLEKLPEKQDSKLIDFNDRSERKAVKVKIKDTKDGDDKLTSDKFKSDFESDRHNSTSIRPTSSILDRQTDYMSLGARPKVKYPEKN